MRGRGDRKWVPIVNKGLVTREKEHFHLIEKSKAKADSFFLDGSLGCRTRVGSSLQGSVKEAQQWTLVVVRKQVENIRWTTQHLLETENLDSHSKGASTSYQGSNITSKLRTNTQLFIKCTHASVHPHSPHASTESLSHRFDLCLLTLTPLPLCSSLSQPSAPCLQAPWVHEKRIFYPTTIESKLFVLFLMFCTPREFLPKTF